MDIAIVYYAERVRCNKNDVALICLDIPEDMTKEDIAYYMGRKNGEIVKVADLNYIFWVNDDDRNRPT
jgi:hypothetical protein